MMLHTWAPRPSFSLHDDTEVAATNRLQSGWAGKKGKAWNVCMQSTELGNLFQIRLLFWHFYYGLINHRLNLSPAWPYTLTGGFEICTISCSSLSDSDQDSHDTRGDYKCIKVTNYSFTSTFTLPPRFYVFLFHQYSTLFDSNIVLLESKIQENRRNTANYETESTPIWRFWWNPQLCLLFETITALQREK
jgi:hypothetical protein